jgi:Fic family protein
MPQTPEEKEVVLLSKAYEELHSLARPPELSVEYIRRIHGRLFPDGLGLDAGPIGRFKETPNGVYSQTEGRMIFDATPPERTEAEVEALLEWIKDDARVLPPAVGSALFFVEFQAIHPFGDGNGRVGRFLNLVVLRRLGYRNVCLVPLDGRFFRTRNRYYKTLRTTNAGRNYQLWCRYFAEQLERAYQLAVSRADLRPLLDKFSRASTRSLLEWCLAGDGGWFSRSDFPNPKGYSLPAITSSLAELMRTGVLNGRGMKRGREYRLSTEFLRKVYGRELIMA